MSSFLAWQKPTIWEMAAHWEDMRERRNMMTLIESQVVLGTDCFQGGGKVWALPEAPSGLKESLCRSFFPHLTCHDQEAFVWLFEPYK